MVRLWLQIKKLLFYFYLTKRELIHNVTWYLTYIHVQVFLSKLLSNFLCVVHDLHNDKTVFFSAICLFVSVCFALDYVKELRKLVFTMPAADLKAVSEKHSAQAPQSLTMQFPVRRRKEEAVKLHDGRKRG